jgi:outer membrane protein OmpA-like peptidoglycan-associated protein
MKRIHKSIILAAALGFSSALPAQQFTNISLSNVAIINSDAFEFSPTFYKDGIILSNNAIDGRSKIYDKEINAKTMSIFIAKQNEKGQLNKPEPFSLNLVSALHEGPLTFDSKQETVFFCRNDNKTSEKARYVGKVSFMKIYASHKNGDGIWSPAEELPFNLDKSDACHPSLSADGERLYFSSNRSGGYGGMDLYVCEKVNGSWGNPINLGAKINTDKNDVFPFIHEDNTLYYSSDGAKSSGGLDIFYTAPDAKGGYKTPQNMGSPFNSNKDDFGFILNDKGKLGYLTSDRQGGKGADDIYSFAFEKGFKPYPNEDNKNCCEKIDLENRLVKVHVIDRKTGKPLEKVSINGGSANAKNILTDKNGQLDLPLSRVNDYVFNINKNNYTSQSVSYNQNDERTDIIVLLNNTDDEKMETLKVALVPKKEATEFLEPKAKFVNEEKAPFMLRNIYYDFDKFNIRNDAQNTLDTLIKILNTHPDMKIELVSHTDSRGKNEYNDNLSLNRTSSAAAYLMRKGISPTRLVSSFFGETTLTNACKDEVPCPENEHQMNRRTEIKIIKK